MATSEQAVWLSQLNNGTQVSNIDCNEELLAMCARQDQAALRELFTRHERAIFGMLLRTLGNRQDAEEAVSDVFVKVWKSAATFKGDSKFTTWLYRIATNTARDYLRSRASKQRLKLQSIERYDGTTLEIAAPTHLNPEESAIASSEWNTVVAALAELSDEDRMLIVLYHFQELEYDEVCQATGISPENLKVRLFRARQRLKKLCEKTEKDSVS